jgi:hypothetical protein
MFQTCDDFKVSALCFFRKKVFLSTGKIMAVYATLRRTILQESDQSSFASLAEKFALWQKSFSNSMQAYLQV